MKRQRARALLPLSLVGVAGAGYLPWQDMTPADWIYDVATRVALVDGHQVDYPTPTAELAKALESRTEPEALRHLAEARAALGDRAGALDALERWARSQGPEAWDEAARWAAERLEMAFAFRAAEQALTGVEPEARRALADQRVSWADAHPDLADPIVLREARSRLFPEDPQALEDWLRALEKGGRIDEAEAALAHSSALGAERALLLRADLRADHGDQRRAFEVLDAAIAQPWGPDVRRAYAKRVERGNPSAPGSWRASLEQRFDAGALVRLDAYFQGQGRGDAASDLLQQVERRYEKSFDRAAWLLLARLHGELDQVPEAFRAQLAAAQSATGDTQADDLARLAQLALSAGGRPLPWGTYNDEGYRWIARLDRTPGFWTGGLSFLLTGQDWKEALARLEAEALPERTFETARVLADELARRAPRHAELAGLRVAIMERHVERGEGRAALALLPLVEPADAKVADEGRRIALLAMRQAESPLADEARLYRERLRFRAADGSRPAANAGRDDDAGVYEAQDGDEPWRRTPKRDTAPSYHDILDEAVARLDQRDPTHRASLALLLAEMDRMPDAEALWSELAHRLESWNLDDDLGPRYEHALERFKGPEWWSRAARWYAKRSRQADLLRLADDLAGRFRGTRIFERAQDASVLLEIPEQPKVGERVRLAPWGDWVRLKALERFPHSAVAYREALGHLLRRSDWDDELARRGAARLAKQRPDRVVVPDELLEARRWALLFVDDAERESYLANLMAKGELAARLAELEKRTTRSPVEERLLFDGWARLSRFEQAAPAADRLAAAYPGDGALAQSILSLHRSLAGLDPSHAAPARSLVERSAPALVDPGPLWTALGELQEERGHPEASVELWRKLVERDPRNPARISELATLLWDYNHMGEALQVVETGRALIARPRFFAFETGVLREENHDIDGAVREYLNALWPETGACYCSNFEADQRSLRRLAQLLGRARVLHAVEARVRALKAGAGADEEALAAFFPIATIETPEPGLYWDADEWIDRMDMPNDAVGREQRDRARADARPREHAGIAEVADVLLAKAEEMAPAATKGEFLDAVERWAEPLLQARDAERAVGLKGAILGRRAALAPSEEDRIAREVERARYLAEHGRRADADALWTSLASRIDALPEGAARMHAEAERAAFVERTQGAAAAEQVWSRIGARYPWSAGVLDDHLAFLARNGRGEQARRVLEAAIPAAALGHREALLTRLTQESLEAGDLPRARGAVERLLPEATLDEPHRLGAIHLLARLRLKEDAGFDPLALAKAESEKLRKELHADLYEQLARAAADEKRWATATTLWIEALNRRLERSWLAEANRSAARAGKGQELLTFFEQQQARSPRDVRWAVAVRELRRDADDAEGAIAMAKAAVAVRPDRESLWREAADLMIRADRVHEAADFLAGWQKPRAADETATAWRGRLYAHAGDGDAALAVERAALDAYEHEKPLDQDRRKELGERQARAARRLVAYGYPKLAWRLLAPAGEVAKVAASRLGDSEQAELALATSNFLRLLKERSRSQDYRDAAAKALAERGRPEQLEEAQGFLLARLFPAPGGTARSDAALRLWWPFIEAANLEKPLRVAIAERLVAGTPGPWQAKPTLAFLASVGDEAIDWTTAAGERQRAFGTPSFEALWVRELVRSDRSEEPAALLAPRVATLFAEAHAATPLASDEDAVVPWTRWLADRKALETWARALPSRPAAVADLAAIFSTRRTWDRLWALGARHWEVAPLVALLPEESRTAWFRFWETKPAQPEDSVTRGRRLLAERAATAVGRLVSGAAGAADDPLVAKLRGPRSVGDVLGTDPTWTFAEFDSRTPAALWGERPGEAWYALEALARLRASEKSAALLPLEDPQRGHETERAVLSARLAESLGDAPLALDLLETNPGRAGDAAWLARDLRLLVQAGRSADAEAAFDREVLRQQDKMTPEALRALEALAQDLRLAPPLERLDMAKPLPPALQAYLYDQRGASVAARFATTDPVGFRAALASRWSEREASLGAEQIRYWLSELWATGAGTLPRQGLRRLAGLWPRAADWLDRQLPADRAEALAAVTALPDMQRFDALVRRRSDEKEDVPRLLALRAALARGDSASAQQQFDAMLGEVDREAPLTYSTVTPAEEDAVSQDDEGAYEEADESGAARTSAPEDPLAARLAAWLAPFAEAKQSALVVDRVRDVLRERRVRGSLPLPSWTLAFKLARDDAERAGLDRELEHAWLRGDWEPEQLQPLVEMLAAEAPALAPRWIARWPFSERVADIAARARVLQRIKDDAGAALLLVEARQRVLWTAVDEVRAFDQWRRLALPPATPTPRPGAVATPVAWAAARAFWTKTPAEAAAALEELLRAHPYDLLSARAALRSVGPAAEEPLLRAAAAIDVPALRDLGDSWADANLIRLRIARGLLPISWRTAAASLADVNADNLGRDLVRRRLPRAEIDAALADVARIATLEGDVRSADAVLAVLADRKAALLQALRAELAQHRKPAAPEAFRIADGRPAPYRPRDLSWRVVEGVIAAEERR